MMKRRVGEDREKKEMKKLKNSRELAASKLNESDLTRNGTGGHNFHF